MVSTLTDLCLDHLVHEYRHTSDTHIREQICQSLPHPLVHVFIKKIRIKSNGVMGLIVDNWLETILKACMPGLSGHLSNAFQSMIHFSNQNNKKPNVVETREPIGGKPLNDSYKTAMQLRRLWTEIKEKRKDPNCTSIKQHNSKKAKTN